jgi:hypothetical protein
MNRAQLAPAPVSCERCHRLGVGSWTLGVDVVS